jgi:hypothetical protein
MNERLMNNIEKTIAHVSRQIRRESEVDSKSVLALGRLIRSYSSLLEKTEEKEWDYEMNGDPYLHEQHEDRERERNALRRRDQEEAEKLGLDPDTLEEDDPDDDDEDEQDDD